MFEQYSDEPVYNVKAVSHQTGVAAATLRAWERRYGVPSPPRTDSGYRLYSARDVAIIRWLKAQIENGMSISQAVHLLRSLESQSADGRVGEPAAERRQPDAPASYQRLHDEIIAGAVEFDEAHIEYALAEAFSLFPVEEVCLNLIQPALVTLGEKWHIGEINISVEHFATNIMRRKLLALMSASPPVSREERIVSGCAPGEYHELGILMLSLFLRRRGYGVIYLGQNIAAARFQEMLSKTQPNLLLLSASGLIAAANLLDVVEELRHHAAQLSAMVAFGGRVFNRVPELRQRVPGVYVGDDAQAAMRRITELLADKAAETVPQQVDYAPVDAETLDALAALRRHRPEIIAVATRLIQNHAEYEPAHKQLLQANENLLQIVESALRFGEPSVLHDRMNWLWDALPPDGISSA
ncbi:MAG: MerR family transcriptional regulator, partial [Anaerolineae bacterium]|nr:MerR family transcriptional regulator [Candidatus Roseilinea sp.]MDW8449977.1 MerR family transcriptional regulator [Anaerolineae bacterium]